MFSFKSFTGNLKWSGHSNYRAFSRIIWSCVFLTVFCLFPSREDLFEEMLQEPHEIARKRRRCREMLQIYQHALYVGIASTYYFNQRYNLTRFTFFEYVKLGSLLIEIGSMIFLRWSWSMVLVFVWLGSLNYVSISF